MTAERGTDYWLDQRAEADIEAWQLWQWRYGGEPDPESDYHAARLDFEKNGPDQEAPPLLVLAEARQEPLEVSDGPF